MAKKKIRVGIVYGGRSGEHEVSLASATSVMANLDKDKYEAIPIAITKEGSWLLGTKPQQLLAAENGVNAEHQDAEVKSSRAVTLTGDPRLRRLIPIERGKIWATRARWMSFSPCCTAPMAKMARCKGCSRWRVCLT